MPLAIRFVGVGFFGSGVRGILRLSGRIVLNAFWFVDGGESLDVEAFVVGVASGGVDVEAFHEEDADADVGFHVGGEPDFVVEIGLLEDEAGAFLEIGEESAGDAEVADKIGFEAGDFVSLLVNPDDTGKFVDNFFHHFVGLKFGIGLEVEDEDVLAAEAFAAGVDELGGAKKGFDADIGVVFVLLFLCFFLGFFVLGFFFGFALLDFRDFFLGFLVFFLLLFVAERLAIFFDEGGDFVAV